MSELMHSSNGRKNYRRQLLTSVSALALLGLVCVAVEPAAADDNADHPTVWIELGGQLDRLDGGLAQFDPHFFDTVTKWGLESPLQAGKPSIYGNGAEAAISFTPNDSDWVFSASVRYGRSNGHKFLHQQTKLTTPRITGTGTKYVLRYALTEADNSGAHLIADFQAGKDVGLGMFGSASTSVISAGIRFAQFNAKSDADIRARPDARFVDISAYGYKIPFAEFHEYYATARRATSFHGFGPSLSWKASAPLVGNPQNVEIAFDWGANAAILFGRQKAATHHHSTGNYHYRNGFAPVTAVLTPHTGGGDRNHSVVTPNLGAFAGVSFSFSNSKVSFGYRGDFFFGAMDGGLDTHKSYNQEFYGPFASVSVGIGG